MESETTPAEPHRCRRPARVAIGVAGLERRQFLDLSARATMPSQITWAASARIGERISTQPCRIPEPLPPEPDQRQPWGARSRLKAWACSAMRRRSSDRPAVRAAAGPPLPPPRRRAQGRGRFKIQFADAGREAGTQRPRFGNEPEKSVAPPAPQNRRAQRRRPSAPASHGAIRAARLRRTAPRGPPAPVPPASGDICAHHQDRRPAPASSDKPARRLPSPPAAVRR